MTIGVAFECMDGLVMGADRQMTAPEWNKHLEQKIFFTYNSEIALAMIGGNDLGLAKEVWWDLLKLPITDYDSCKEALKKVLDEKGRFYTDLPLELLCGLATKDHTYLLEFRGKGIYPIMDEVGLICSGDSSLIRYLTKNVDMLLQDVNYGVTVATYYLKRAEQFVGTCHSPMDIYVLMPGVPPYIKWIPSDVIEALDKRLVAKQGDVFTELFSLNPPFSIGR